MNRTYKIEDGIPIPQKKRGRPSRTAALEAMLPLLPSGKSMLVNDLTYATVLRVVSTWAAQNGQSRTFIVGPEGRNREMARIWKR